MSERETFATLHEVTVNNDLNRGTMTPWGAMHWAECSCGWMGVRCFSLKVASEWAKHHERTVVA